MSQIKLYLEFYTPGEPNSPDGYTAAGYLREHVHRASYLHAYKSEGKTKYRPVIGSAKDLVVTMNFKAVKLI